MIWDKQKDRRFGRMKLRLLCVALLAVCLMGCSSEKADETGKTTTPVQNQEDNDANKETAGNKDENNQSTKLDNITGNSKTSYVGRTDYDNATKWTTVMQTELEDPSFWLTVTVDYSGVSGFKPISPTGNYVAMFFSHYRNEDTMVYSSISKTYNKTNDDMDLTLRNEAWGWSHPEGDEAEVDFDVDIELKKIYTDRTAEKFIEYYEKDKKFSDEVMANAWEHNEYRVYPVYNDEKARWNYNIMVPYAEHKAYLEMSIVIEQSEMKKDTINKVLDDIELQVITSIDDFDKDKYYVEDYVAHVLSEDYDLAIKEPLRIVEYSSMVQYFLSNGDNHHIVEIETDTKDSKKMLEDCQYMYGDYYVSIDEEEGNYHRLYKVLIDTDIFTNVGFVCFNNQAYRFNRPELTLKDLQDNFLK